MNLRAMSLASLRSMISVGVTGEGQKTSSMLSRALSRIESRFRQRQVRLVWPKLEWRTQVLLSIETEETQLGSLGDQVSSYLYYSGYAEPSTTKATQNTPVVQIWVTTNNHASLVNSGGNPGVSAANPYPTPQKPLPLLRGKGFGGYG